MSPLSARRSTSSGARPLAQSARFALEGARYRTDLERETGQRIHEAVAVQGVIDEAAFALARHQSRVLEHGEMSRDRWRAQAETRCQIGRGQLLRRKERQDLAPRSGGERIEDAIELHSVNS